MEGERYGVIPTNDVRSAMMCVPPPPYQKNPSVSQRPKPVPRKLTRHSALGIPPKKDELADFLSILDPDAEGHTPYEPFFAICALKFHARDHSSASHAAELDEAYALFTHGTEGPITVSHLRRVAALLREEVGEELLRDMVLEGNGGVGVERGVGRGEFDEVMRRAGVWR